MDPDKEKFETVFTGTLWEAEMVKSLLQNAGIESFLRNATVTSYAYEPIRAAGVLVVVSGSDQAVAAEIAADYLRNLRQD